MIGPARRYPQIISITIVPRWEMYIIAVIERFCKARLPVARAGLKHCEGRIAACWTTRNSRFARIKLNLKICIINCANGKENKEKKKKHFKLYDDFTCLCIINNTNFRTVVCVNLLSFYGAIIHILLPIEFTYSTYYIIFFFFFFFLHCTLAICAKPKVSPHAGGCCPAGFLFNAEPKK
ncbi:hypothetical protein PUN28_011522 [Cardiocondyla obscurior]|uniref:Uncharacterized protein n=1 Tax=Cardiocondyla obscurior TaxID=286306 RepID=A0AAW2FIW1_9HYME